MRELYDLSPVGLVGCLGVGAANGAFWTLAPVYAASHGLSTMYVGFFTSAAVLGGAVTQWPLGRWSDRADRRRVIIAAYGAAAIVSATMVLWDASERVVLLLAFLFGGCALPLYALCVAHANDRVPADAFVEVSSGLLMMFGIGAVAGPYLAALPTSAAGSFGVFLFIGGRARRLYRLANARRAACRGVGEGSVRGRAQDDAGGRAPRSARGYERGVLTGAPRSCGSRCKGV